MSPRKSESEVKYIRADSASEGVSLVPEEIGEASTHITASMKDEENSKLSYKVLDVGDGKGRGLVATRTIEAGEVIVIEEPLLVVYSTDNEDILEELVNSSEEVKARIMSLSDLGDLDSGCANFFSSMNLENRHHDMKMLEVLMRKFRANMHSAPGEAEDDICAVYDTICLINHRLELEERVYFAFN